MTRDKRCCVRKQFCGPQRPLSRHMTYLLQLFSETTLRIYSKTYIFSFYPLYNKGNVLLLKAGGVGGGNRENVIVNKKNYVATHNSLTSTVNR